ncbi:hypothetical protein OJF2_47470 [Aquisphaera giovannonii]|uniref:Uncharacterized protein n=1 Tax=Aquisphaera giovannonii TaxID=406548 RepID=A0A5B9W756_9BACT|nr:hypothetical protein [Aquisphaera giovannonii]QEH36187.1 hypothetical protein OJF2_47470 [Aquisphaera giovannonii]
MDRQQREDELKALLTTQRGKEELLETLKKHAGIEAGNLPSFGTLLVQTILNYEYPDAAEPADRTVARAEAESRPGPEPAGTTPETQSAAGSPTTARAKEAPGDTKFDQPPGQESPGG